MLINGGITKLYKETVDGKEQYSMIYNDKKQNVVEYVNNLTKSTTNKNITNNGSTTTNKNTNTDETTNNTTTNTTQNTNTNKN